MKLIKPIKAHNETIAELKWREFSADDVIEAGFPYQSDLRRGVIVYDALAIANLISRLAQIPLSSVRQLSPLDFARAMGEVVGFFGDMEAQSSA